MNHAPGAGKFERLLARCRNLSPIATDVAHLCEAMALPGALDFGCNGVIRPSNGALIDGLLGFDNASSAVHPRFKSLGRMK